MILPFFSLSLPPSSFPPSLLSSSPSWLVKLFRMRSLGFWWVWKPGLLGFWLCEMPGLRVMIQAWASGLLMMWHLWSPGRCGFDDARCLGFWIWWGNDDVGLGFRALDYDRSLGLNAFGDKPGLMMMLEAWASGFSMLRDVWASGGPTCEIMVFTLAARKNGFITLAARKNAVITLAARKNWIITLATANVAGLLIMSEAWASGLMMRDAWASNEGESLGFWPCYTYFWFLLLAKRCFALLPLAKTCFSL